MERRTLIELRAGAPLRVAGRTIVPIERWRVTVAGDGRRLFADAGKEAAGIVILDDSGARAVDEAGRPLDLDDLATRVAGLRHFRS